MKTVINQKLKSIPVVIHENISSERNDVEEYKVFMSKKHPELFNLRINKEACAILDLCDGVATLEDIINIMKNNHSGVETSVLETDLLDFLFSMWRIGVVTWKDINPYKSLFEIENNGLKFKLLDEDEVLSFIHENKGNLNYPCLFNKNFIENISSIKNRVFTGTETFFSINDDINSGFMSLSFVPDGRNSVVLHLYRLDETLFEAPQILEFIDWAINKYSDLINKSFTRVDINLLEGEVSIDPSCIGFTHVGTMKKAIICDNGVKKVEVYSKNLI